MARYLKTLFILLLLAGLVYAGSQITSSTTGTAMIAKVRVLLDEATAVKWSDANLLQFINNGMADIASKSLCYQTSESINLVAGTIEYTPSSDYVAVVGVVYNPASGARRGLKKGNITSIGSVDATDYSDGGLSGEPGFWYEFAGKVGVYPPLPTVTTETVTVYFAKRQSTTISAGSNILTPAIFDNALMYYTMYQAFLMDGRIAEANNYRMMYLQELAQYRMDFVGVDNETTTPVR